MEFNYLFPTGNISSVCGHTQEEIAAYLAGLRDAGAVRTYRVQQPGAGADIVYASFELPGDSLSRSMQDALEQTYHGIPSVQGESIGDAVARMRLVI